MKVFVVLVWLVIDGSAYKYASRTLYPHENCSDAMMESEEIIPATKRHLFKITCERRTY